MILKALTLENFKGIREPVRIEFAPLTLLFGPNNAGKSTIVQALMYAREVLERNNCDAGRTVLGGDVVDLGGFKNLVYGHEPNRVIRMRFELDLREASTRRKTDWVRDNELDNNVEWFYKNAPKKLDVQSGRRLRERLVDVWVQIEIAWSNAAGCPVVQGYSVGMGVDEYARITYDAAKDSALLSYFNFGIYPFGTRYTKGDSTDIQWALAREVREGLRQWIAESGLPELGIKKGAQVGIAGEEVRESDNRLARHVFDEIVSEIVAGDGAWGDSPADEETGEDNPYYAMRLSWAVSAEQRVRIERMVATPPKLSGLIVRSPPCAEAQQDGSSNQAAPAVEQDGGTDCSAQSLDIRDTSHDETQYSLSDATDEDGRADDPWEDRMERAVYNDDHEVESWLLEFFVALIRDGYVPVASDAALPLALKGSALPEWGRTFDVSYREWMPGKWNEFWEHPQFAQEWLKDLLS